MRETLPRTCITARPDGSLLARLAACRRGIAAVEFALVLPILLLLLLGTTELTRALTYDRKVTQVASTVADLAAQASTLSSGEVSDIFKASEAIMQPYPSADLGIVISSVVFDNDGNATVDWSCQHNSTAWSDGTQPPITIPPAIALKNTSVIVAVSDFTYQPVFNSVIAENIELAETFFLRPRLVIKIPDPGC